MTSRTQRPDVAFALPGEWVRADLDDERQVAELTHQLGEHADDAASWLAGATAVGGVVLMLRVRSEVSVALLIAWPPGEQAGDPSLDGLHARLGTDGDVIDHAAGYACVRVRSQAGPDDLDVLTYGLVHPESGRMLLVRVTALDGPLGERDLEDYDLCVSRMWWEERDA